MELREEVAHIRQQGMEKAAVIWETLETLPQPVEPVNIFKAACSVKCAEFMTRVRNHPMALMLMKSVLQFLEATRQVTEDNNGSQEEGMRVVTIFEEAIPLTDEVYNDAAAYATRQHVYDGVIMLAAAKLGKEAEVKDCIDEFQRSVAMAMIRSILAQGEIDLSGFDVKPENE
jgi:hypothetical protein